MRITSNDPQIKQILKGTQGPYGSPANVDNIQQWMRDKGIPASRSQAYRMARSIASHGTPQAGTYSNNKIDDALKEAVLEARK